MSRDHAVLTALAFLASVLLPAAASAMDPSYGFDTDRDRFGWAIMSGGNSTTSDVEDQEALDKLKEEYGGDDFLFLREGDDRYVIRDRGLIERAQRAVKPVNEAGRELGEAVSEQVHLALGTSKDARERARLGRSIGRLSREIARAARRGDDTEDLERGRDKLQRQLDDMEESSRDQRVTVREKTKTKTRSEEASRHLKQAAHHLQDTMHDILHDAKARHLAEPMR